MNHQVEITIRWTDSEGTVLGAKCERIIDLPKWGKKRPMRLEIIKFIKEIECESSNRHGVPDNFTGYAYKAFGISNIISATSKTKGSRISLRGEELQKFIKENEL